MQGSKPFLYQEIAESLRRRIAAGELAPDDKLPPVRQMAKQWNCTPGTVSRAYSMLAQEGLVTTHRGSGTRVAASPLQPQNPTWQWAALVNRAEQFLLDALHSGHTPAQVTSALSVAIARWQEMQQRESPAERPSSGEPEAVLRFAGSHDLTVALLGRMLAEETAGVDFSIEYIGSLGGLMALARGEADVAGTHLWDEGTDTYNIPFIRRLLPGRRVACLTLVHRPLGLIVPPQNPQNVQQVADLARAGVRFVNRQSGSGTRVWLDAQLKRLGIEETAIAGYKREESTHMAVARAVEQEEATVGLGIHAAAAAYGLDFVPLTHEQYDLVFPENVWQSAAAQVLRHVIDSQRFQEAVAALGGYDQSQMGKVMWI